MSDLPVIITPPSDPTIKIWRYMTFAKFVSLLETSALFFTRADQFEDSFEGTTPISDIERSISTMQSSLFEQFKANGVSEEEKPKLWQDFLNMYYPGQKMFSDADRRWMMISCWHMNEHESTAMWKIYSGSGDSIAIQSRYYKFETCLRADSLPETHTLQIGAVKYIDYSKDSIPNFRLTDKFFHKRLSFEYERELRAIIWMPPFKGGGSYGHFDFDAKPPEYGILVPVDIDVLVEQIYVSPKSPGWYKELIEKLLKRYGLEKAVIRSSLDDISLY